MQTLGINTFPDMPTTQVDTTLSQKSCLSFAACLIFSGKGQLTYTNQQLNPSQFVLKNAEDGGDLRTGFYIQGSDQSTDKQVTLACFLVKKGLEYNILMSNTFGHNPS